MLASSHLNEFMLILIVDFGFDGQLVVIRFRIPWTVSSNSILFQTL